MNEQPGFIGFADFAVAVFPLPSSCFALRRAERVRLSILRLAKAKKKRSSDRIF